MRRLSLIATFAATDPLAAIVVLVAGLAGCAAVQSAPAASATGSERAATPAAPAWEQAPVPASAATRLDFADARQLLTRTGFAPDRATIEGWVGRTRENAVDALLAAQRTTPVIAPPAWTSDPENLLHGRRPRDLTADERKALQRDRRARGRSSSPNGGSPRCARPIHRLSSG